MYTGRKCKILTPVLSPTTFLLETFNAAEWVQLFKYTDGGGNTQSGAVADPVCRRDLLLRRCNGSFFKLSYHGPVGLGVSEFDA
jgi:hypothetical protein